MIRLIALALVGFAVFIYTAGADGEFVRNLFGENGAALAIDQQDLGALAATLGLLLLVVPAVVGAYRGRMAGAVRDLASWTAIGVVLVGGYSYRDELGRIAYRLAGEFSPPGSSLGVEQRQAGESAVKIRRRGDGHFVARVTVNGASATMLVDTGASTVVLSQSDAKLLGVDTRRLKYSVPVQTANGLAYAAHARLPSVAVGSISLANVDALVAQPGVLRESLLGMTFLSRLRSYEFAGEFLTFRN